MRDVGGEQERGESKANAYPPRPSGASRISFRLMRNRGVARTLGGPCNRDSRHRVECPPYDSSFSGGGLCPFCAPFGSARSTPSKDCPSEVVDRDTPSSPSTPSKGVEGVRFPPAWALRRAIPHAPFNSSHPAGATSPGMGGFPAAPARRPQPHLYSPCPPLPERQLCRQQRNAGVRWKKRVAEESGTPYWSAAVSPGTDRSLGAAPTASRPPA